MTLTHDGKLGLGVTTASHKLHIIANNEQYPITLVHNVTDPSLDYYFGQFIDANFSGSGATGGDREQGGLFIDVDSSTTGGDTSDEHRAYGLNVDTRASGDSDLVYGGRFVTYSNLSTADTTTEVKGIHSQAYASNSNGTVANTFGSVSFAYADCSGSGTATSLYGAYGKAATLSGFSGTVGTARGVYGEFESNGSGTTTHGKVFESVIDMNSGSLTNGYLFYGNYQSATGVSNPFGLHLTGEDRNYLSGKLGIGTSNPLQMLHLKDHTANDGPIIRLEGDSHDTAGNLLGGIEAYNADPSGDGPNVVSAIKFLTHEDIDHGGQLAFYTHDGTEGGEGSAPVERMRIDNNGNVGIGVTPESDWNSLGKIIQLAQTSSIGGYTASSLWLNENCKYTSSGWEYINSDLTSSMWLDGGMIGFRVAPSGTADTAISWNTAMTIDNNGQVNICDQSSVTGADLTVGALGLASNITRSIEELSGHGGTVTASGNIEIDIFYGSQSAASTLVEIEIMAYSGKYLSYKHGSYWGTNWSGPHNNTVIENANSGFTVTYDTNPTNAHEVFTITNSAGITYPVIRVRALCGGHVTSTNPQITFTYTES